MVYEFRQDVTLANFTNRATTLVSSTMQDVFKMKLGAKQVAFWGHGNDKKGFDDRAPFTIEFQETDGTPVHGSVRLITQTANEYHAGTYTDFRTENSLEAVRDKGYAIKSGETNAQGQRVGAGEDAYLVIQFKPDEDKVIDVTKCKLIATITKQEE
jgi:hypothetical protein